MELLDKFNSAIDDIYSLSNKDLRQEEIIFSSINPSEAFSISDDEFKDLVDALELNFYKTCMPLSKKLEFCMTNHFSPKVKYKEVYSQILKNLKQSIGYIMDNFNNKACITVKLTCSQVEVSLNELALKPNQDDKALLYKLRNSRFFNADVKKYKVGQFRVYDISLVGVWDLSQKSSADPIMSTRRGQWEKRL